MKPLEILTEAIQDIIVRSFGVDDHKDKDIREIAQEALRNYKKTFPKPNFSCPKNFMVGEDYKKFPACERCPETYAQVCNVYNYIWYGGGKPYETDV